MKKKLSLEEFHRLKLSLEEAMSAHFKGDKGASLSIAETAKVYGCIYEKKWEEKK